MQPAQISKAVDPLTSNQPSNMSSLGGLCPSTLFPIFPLGVTFVDGTTGEVDLRTFLNGTQVKGTVFEPLRDQAVFAQVRVVMGAVQWPNGADLAPDAMYDAIKAHGRWMSSN